MSFGHGKITTRLAAAWAMALAGVALIGWGLFSFLAPKSGNPAASAVQSASVPTSAFAQPHKWPCPIPGDFKEVDVPVALLCDYYEHGIEHAPPRDPSGVMQKRELFYAAPHDPFEGITAALSSHHSQKIRGQFERWRERWLRGESGGDELARIVQAVPVTSDVAIEAGRGLNWLIDDRIAAAFFRAGLARAEKEYGSVAAGDPAARPVLHAVCQTKALWRLEAYPILETRFGLEMRLNPTLSAESRRAGYLKAEMLFYQEEYNQAADLIEAVAAEHAKAGDLGVVERLDLDEMAWVRGLFNFQAGRLRGALKWLGECDRLRGPHAGQASLNIFRVYLAQNHLEKAAKQLKLYEAAYAPSALVKEQMNALLQSQRVSIPPVPTFADVGPDDANENR